LSSSSEYLSCAVVIERHPLTTAQLNEEASDVSDDVKPSSILFPVKPICAHNGLNGDRQHHPCRLDRDCFFVPQKIDPQKRWRLLTTEHS